MPKYMTLCTAKCEVASYEVHKITTMSIPNSILVANSMYAHCVMNFILCILQCANYSVASWIAVVLLGVANWHNNTDASVVA